MLGGAVVVTGDGARTDVGISAHEGVADVAQVIGLGAGLDRRLFDLDEISNACTLAQLGARSEPREGADRNALADVCAGEMRKRMDHGAVRDADFLTEDDVWLD